MESLTQQKNAVKWLRVLYPIWAVVGMFSLMYVPSQLIDSGNPELTITNIVANETLFRLGIAGGLITQLFSVGAVWFLYKLFYHSYKEAVILMAVFTFLGMPIVMVSSAFNLGALEVTDNVDQAYLLLQLNNRGTMVATIFWGLWLLPLGYMIIQSPLFPKVIGWLVIAAGAGYTLSAFSYFLGLQGIFNDVFEYLTFGEVIWMLWVMIMGARWKAVAS